MSDRPWHKRYHGDALTGFMVLTLEERGAYQTLLDLMYDAGGPIPDNENVLARYMGVSIRKWRSIRHALVEVHSKISVDDTGRLTNARVISEVENAAKTSRKNSENATKPKRKNREVGKNDNKNNEGAENSLPDTRAFPDTRYQIPEEEDKPPLPRETRGDGEGDLFEQDDDPPAPAGKAYAYVGAVIRLTAPDFERWRLAYHAIPDIRAEIEAIDDWLKGQPDKHGKWFHIASGSLSRKHQDFAAKAAAAAGARRRRTYTPEELDAARQRLADREGRNTLVTATGAH